MSTEYLRHAVVDIYFCDLSATAEFDDNDEKTS